MYKKRKFSSLLRLMAILLVIHSLVVYASAAGKADCPECENETDGLTFSLNEQYIIGEKFDQTPLTFEATFTVSKSKLKSVTTILGSDGSFHPAVAFYLNKNGNPVVMFRNSASHSEKYEYVFSNVNVATGKKVHMAIVTDFSGKKLHCYVDGRLAQTITGIVAISPYQDKFNMVIGGDYYKCNASYFPGTIDAIALWSDMRTAAEITADYSNGISVSDNNLLAYYDLTRCDGCIVEDLSANNNDLDHIVLWQDEKDVDPVTDYDYSFAVIGDTQKMCVSYPDAMRSVYDWVVANKDTQKIKHVIGLGDITDESTDKEWELAKATIGKLDGKISYTLARGNHDDWDDFNRNFHSTNFGKSLDGLMNAGNIDLSNPVGQPGVLKKVAADGTVSYVTRLGDVPEGGVVKGDLTNAYQYLDIGNTKYIIITLDFAPSGAVLTWLDTVLTENADRKAIIVTHAYMFHDGTTIGLGDSTPPSKYSGYTNAQNGVDIWEKSLSKHENVLMVLSGHDPWQHIIYRQDRGIHGNTVTQMLIDPQGIDAYLGPSGMVAMLYFSEKEETVTVRYYSVTKDCYGSEISQFTVHLNHDFTQIAETAPTCKEVGQKTYSCPCGYIGTEEIAKLNTHTYTDAKDQFCNICDKERVMISSQPTDVEVAANSKVNISVTATGINLKYRWQVKTPDSDWKDTTTPGFKTNTLTVSAKSYRNGYQYRCAITDATGEKIYSDSAALTVVATKITKQPASVKVTADSETKISVAVRGVGLQYQWQVMVPNGEWKNTDAPGYKTNTITVNATIERNGYQYRCVITDAAGKTICSKSATLTVANTKITKQPESICVTAKSKAEIRVTVEGSNLKYRWQVKTPGGEWKYTTTPGFKTNTLTVSAKVSRNGYQYRCVITDSIGQTFYTDSATLTVVSTKITKQPASVNVTVNSKTKISVSVAGSDLKYQWQVKTPNGEWKNTTTPGYKTNTITVSATTKRNGYRYRCIITDTAGKTIYTDSATLTVVSTKITKQPESICVTAKSKAEIRVTVEGSNLKYRWQVKTPNGEWKNTTTPGFKTNTLTVNAKASRNGYQYRCAITDTAGKTIYTDSATLTVVSTKITQQPTSVSVTANSKTKISVVATGLDLKYQWQVKTPNGEWKNTTTPGYETNTITVSAKAARNGYQYRCVITDAAGKTTYSKSAKLTVITTKK